MNVGTAAEPVPACQSLDAKKVGEACTQNDECELVAFCGTAQCGGTGICVERSAPCTGIVYEVCLCDGTISDACEASVAGKNVDDTFSCAAPEGAFVCGAYYCYSEVSHCQVAAPAADQAAGDCLDLPQACKAPGAGCDCFPPEALSPPGQTCQCSTDAGHFVLTCSASM